jgi:hypothetical protein
MQEGNRPIRKKLPLSHQMKEQDSEMLTSQGTGVSRKVTMYRLHGAK